MTSPRAPRAHEATGSAARVRDVAAIAVVVLFAVLPFPEEGFRATGLPLVVALLPVLVLPCRRRRPFVALAVSVLCLVVVALTGVLAPGTLIAVAITAFSVADLSRRTVAVGSVAAAATVVFFVAAVPLDGDLLDPRALQLVMLVVLGGTLGDAARSRRDAARSRREALAAATERAERAERDRDDEARRRVVEERVRIARDLHDVVAHQIAVISLSAGVASSAMGTRPERAREALTTIRSAARTVLTDIGGLMALLRADDPDELRDLHPQAGLAQLDELLDSFADVGLEVELRRDHDARDGGAPRRDHDPGDRPAAVLSPAGDHVAYLALQEGLTNAHKHGAGERAVVDVRSRDGAVHLTVSNAVRPDRTERSSDGHGLRGVRERVASVRGHVEATRDGGRFTLHVTVPLESDGAR